MAKFVVCACVLLLSVFAPNLMAKESHDEEETISVELPPVYASPVPSGFAYLAEHFDDIQRFANTWQISQAKKEGIDEDIAKYDGKFFIYRYACYKTFFIIEVAEFP